MLNFYKECMENNDNSLLSVLGKLTGLFKNEKNKAFATDDFIKKHNTLANKIKDKNS